jgi:peptidyl-tRNA hydrolase
MKMYCVVARDSLKAMNGNRGKLAAQAGHAYLHAYWDAEDRFRYTSSDSWSSHTKYWTDVVETYRNSGRATKVCLIVETVDDLKALHDFYKPICGVSLVTDAGLTCFDGPTTTCLGIGPISEDKVDVNLSSLKVLI